MDQLTDSSPEHLNHFPLFNGITYSELARMEKISVKRFVKAGHELHFSNSSNNHVYFLLSGAMKTIAANEDKELIKSLVKPGSLVGHIPLLEQVERPGNYAVAILDSMILLLDTQLLLDWTKKYEFFRIRLKKLIAEKIHKMEDRLIALTQKTAYERIHDFLISFAEEFGEMNHDGWNVSNFLNHSHIAQLCSVSRQKVSEVFSDLRKKNLIRYDKNNICIFKERQNKGL